MAGKFLSLEEAAKLIGVSTDALNELRDRREIYAYRDGGVWKFKTEDVDRLIADRKAAGGEPLAPEFAEFDENLDSILLSEVELGGQSGASPSSTVIGKSNAPSSPESDIQLAERGKEGSDIKIEVNPSHSDVRLASTSDLLKPGSDLSSKFDELDALDLDLTSTAGSGISLGSDAVSLHGDDDLTLDDQELALGEEPKTAKTGSGLSGSGDSSIDLAESDDEIVLGGSGPGSDVTRSTSDSGISLIDPTDSGLSLEEAPLELGGSQVESLELGEDDMILLDESTDSEGATQLKADDEFLLTPLDEGVSEDLSDSGSQVIALDSDVEFDESAATMLGNRASMPQMLEEDLEGSLGGGVPGRGMAAPGVGVAPGMMSAQVMEAPFSVWNIALLAICVLFLMVTGMMMYDLMRNMWSWNTPYPVNSSLMDAILGWFEK